MADSLSISASIAGLIALTFDLIKLISNVRGSLGGEPAHLMQNVSEDMELFCSALSHIEVWCSAIEGKPDVDAKSDMNCTLNRSLQKDLMELQPFVANCRSLIEKITAHILPLESTLKRKGIWKLFSVLKVKESLKQLERLRDDLESSKSTLIVSLIVFERHSKDISKPLESLTKNIAAISNICGSIESQKGTLGLTEASIPIEQKSFQDWLGSFSERNGEENTGDYPQNIADSIEEEHIDSSSKSFNNPDQIEIRVRGLRNGYGSLATEIFVLDRYAPLSDLFQQLENIGGNSDIHGFRADKGEIPFGLVIPRIDHVNISVTHGPSSYSKKQGFRINIYERLIDYVNKLIENPDSRNLLMVPSTEISLKSQAYCQGLRVESPALKGSGKIRNSILRFQRCLRIPDDGQLYTETTDFGTLPLGLISDFKDQLPEENLKKGGYFIPLFQREALAIACTSWKPAGSTITPEEEAFGVKVYAGSINVLTGMTALGGMGMELDHIVIPKQGRLDGFRSSDKVVRQFVGMPLSWGYSLEQQLTGREFIGGIQMQIAPKIDLELQFNKTCEHGKKSTSGHNLDPYKSPIELDLENSSICLRLLPQTEWRLKYSEDGKLPSVLEYATGSDNWGTPPARLTLIDDIVLSLLGSGSIPPKSSVYLRPIGSISFIIKVISVGNVGNLTELDTWSETFSPFLDLHDFINAIDKQIVEKLGLQRNRNEFYQRSLIEINGFHINSIKGLYTENEYNPLANINTISNGGTLNFYFHAAKKHLDTEYRMGIEPCSFHSSTVSKADNIEIGLGIQGLINQDIKTTERPTLWDWSHSQFINIQIINAAVFQHVTGLREISPVPLRLLDKNSLPTAISLEEPSSTIVSFLQTVEELGFQKQPIISLRVGKDSPIVGCACCEVNYSDTIMLPCNHVFCAECINNEMTEACGTITCDACSRISEGLVPFSGAMKIAAPPRVDQSLSINCNLMKNKTLLSPVYAINSETGAQIQNIIINLQKLANLNYDSIAWSFKRLIKVLSHYPSLLLLAIRQFKNFSYDVRALLIFEVLQSADEWPVSHNARRFRTNLYTEVARGKIMLKSLLSLLPNIDDMHRDGKTYRIREILCPRLYSWASHYLLYQVVDILFKWIISGSYSLSELGISAPELIADLSSHQSTESIDSVLTYLRSQHVSEI